MLLTERNETYSQWQIWSGAMGESTPNPLRHFRTINLLILYNILTILILIIWAKKNIKTTPWENFQIYFCFLFTDNIIYKVIDEFWICPYSFSV